MLSWVTLYHLLLPVEPRKTSQGIPNPWQRGQLQQSQSLIDRLVQCSAGLASTQSCFLAGSSTQCHLTSLSNDLFDSCFQAFLPPKMQPLGYFISYILACGKLVFDFLIICSVRSKPRELRILPLTDLQPGAALLGC